MKELIRNLSLKIIDLFASEINDCMTGRRLGRGLVIGWGGRIQVVNYHGRPLVPMFLHQSRMTFWRQQVGFTSHPDPDFPRIAPREIAEVSPGKRVLNLIITHVGGEGFLRLREQWRGVCAEEDLWIVFGGSRADFETLDYARKIFVEDPALRTRDHQREKQSYEGLLQAVLPMIREEAPDYIHLCEYDHLPVVSDLNARQVETIRKEGADVMAHYLIRSDRTCWPIGLAHESDPEFYPFWKSLSRREDPSVVLWMFGSGSFWTREAFLAVASTPQSIDCYFEIFLPTLAHHLGYRVRCWREDQHLIKNKPAPEVTLENARKRGDWTVHPVKG
jgi:hypothetical protein